MKINSDFKDLLRDLNGAGVRYLIVGGYAVMVYTEPRYTKDLDLWIEPTKPNAQKLFLALAQFGAPTKISGPERFHRAGRILPNRNRTGSYRHHDVDCRDRFCSSLGAQDDCRLRRRIRARTLS